MDELKSLGFALRAEPATSLSRYSLTTECLGDSSVGLLAWGMA
ncbi:hypothetical protein AB6H26_04345 [Providencia hangzhouensis]